MSTSNIASLFSSSDSANLQLLQMKNSNITSLLSPNSKSNNTINSVLSGLSDLSSISAIASCMSSIYTLAKKQEVEDCMGNVELFVSTLQDEGQSDLNILNYLAQTRNILESDPEEFATIFAEKAESEGTEESSEE